MGREDSIPRPSGACDRRPTAASAVPSFTQVFLLPKYTPPTAQALHQETRSHSSRASRLSQIHGETASKVQEERRSAAASRLAAHVAETVALWPDLTPDQLNRISTLLTSDRREVHES